MAAIIILVQDAKGNPAPGISVTMRSVGNRPLINDRWDRTLTSDARGRIEIIVPSHCRLEAEIFEVIHEIVVNHHPRQWFEIRS